MLNTLLSADRIQLSASATSKKKALQILSVLFADSDHSLNQNQVFDALTAREKLGSTGMGEGIAIPHCRIAECKKPQACILTLDQGIDFDALDGKPVDLLWALIVPEQATDEHLQILAKLAEILSQQNIRQDIRKAHNRESLYDTLCQLEAEPH